MLMTKTTKKIFLNYMNRNEIKELFKIKWVTKILFKKYCILVIWQQNQILQDRASW